MCDEMTGPDTIFYTLKLKKTRTSGEVFEKMKKCVKKKGATKNWNCNVENDVFTVDFGDERSETFQISFDENRICSDFCKVYFPTSGELFDDEKNSEFKAMLNMIISAKAMFSQMEINDDYGIAADYAESKKYKLQLRELTELELSLAHDIYDSMIENKLPESYPQFLLLLVGKALNIPVTANYNDYINDNIMNKNNNFGEKEIPIFETYLYETSEFKGKRLSEYSELEYTTDSPGFAVMTFLLAANELYCYRDFYKLGNKCLPWGRYPEIHKFYRDKVYPQLDTLPDGFEKCCLANRFFLSAFDFCGFKFVGKC